MAATAQETGAGDAGLVSRVWHSSLGRKYIMAVTGLGLYVFVIFHMLGNLQVFAGPEKINAYAFVLKSNPVIVWGGRIGLLTITVLHIISAMLLAESNVRARPVKYANRKPVSTTFAQRTIVISGLVLLAFIIFHLSHFTLGFVDSQFLQLRDSSGRHDVYGMIVKGFSNPYVSAFYIISMGLLMLHLSHGVSSLFQSLGLRSNNSFVYFDRLAKSTALLIFLGNCMIPISILAGWIK